MLLGSHKVRNRLDMSLAMSSRSRWFSASTRHWDCWSSILRCMAYHTGWATILFATFTLSHSFQPPDRILLAPRYLATICVRMSWLTCSYPSTLRRSSISPNWDSATRHPRRPEKFGIRLLMRLLALNLCLHRLVFLNAFIGDSALSRKHVAELRRKCLLPQENTTKVSIYMIYTNRQWNTTIITSMSL